MLPTSLALHEVNPQSGKMKWLVVPNVQSQELSRMASAD
jgi:hypothetical protein